MRWLGPVFLAVILPLLLSEFTDWCPWFARRLVRRAVRRLPKGSRARWAEEWSGDLAAFEGRGLSVLVRGIWIYFRAPSWGRMLRGLPLVSQVLVGRLRALVRRPKKDKPVALETTMIIHPAATERGLRVASTLGTIDARQVTILELGDGRNVVAFNTDDGGQESFAVSDRELSEIRAFGVVVARDHETASD
jgi:hypothetical protein